MDLLPDILHSTNVAFIKKSKKDKKQGYYQQAKKLKPVNKKRTTNLDDQSNELQWAEYDRRSGIDRREKETTIHTKFEHRFSKDRRKSKTLSVTA